MTWPTKYPGWFFIGFAAQMSFWLSVNIWYSVAYGEREGVVSIAQQIGGGTGAAVFLSAAVTVAVVEGCDMIAEQFARRRYKKGLEEGRKKTDKVWRDWYEKHAKTLNGVEPPPPPPDDED